MKRPWMHNYKWDLLDGSKWHAFLPNMENIWLKTMLNIRLNHIFSTNIPYIGIHKCVKHQKNTFIYICFNKYTFIYILLNIKNKCVSQYSQYPSDFHMPSLVVRDAVNNTVPTTPSRCDASGWVTERQPLPGESSPGYIVRLAWQGWEIQNVCRFGWKKTCINM